MVYIIMGVSGCGKTTIGRMLAERLGLGFYDGDDYHSQENINKMKNLVSLNDEDRFSWLSDLAVHISGWNRSEGAVLACSALKEKYRRILTNNGAEKVLFVYLRGSEEIILERIRKRKGHFFPGDLLRTQFSILEEPKDAITVDTARSPEEICVAVVEELSRRSALCH